MYSSAGLLINTPDRIWELTADTPKERDEWVEMLSALILGKSRERLKVRMIGPLIKQGHIIRNWKSRYRFSLQLFPRYRPSCCLSSVSNCVTISSLERTMTIPICKYPAHTHRSWFVVGNVAMYYFETEAQAAKVTALAPPSIDALPEPLRKDMKGIIPLKNAETKKLDSHDGRTYAFCVTSAGTPNYLVGTELGNVQPILNDMPAFA